MAQGSRQSASRVIRTCLIPHIYRHKQQRTQINICINAFHISVCWCDFGHGDSKHYFTSQTNHGVTITRCATGWHFHIWNMTVSLRNTDVAVFLLVKNWRTRQRIRHTLIVVYHHLRLFGDKTIPDSAIDQPNISRCNGFYVQDNQCLSSPDVSYPWNIRFQHQTCFQIAKFMGPTWGPPGYCRPQMGSLLAPWTLLSRFVSTCTQRSKIQACDQLISHPLHESTCYSVTCIYIFTSVSIHFSVGMKNHE